LTSWLGIPFFQLMRNLVMTRIEMPASSMGSHTNINLMLKKIAMAMASYCSRFITYMSLLFWMFALATRLSKTSRSTSRRPSKEICCSQQQRLLFSPSAIQDNFLLLRSSSPSGPLCRCQPRYSGGPTGIASKALTISPSNASLTHKFLIILK
jgi:hypothetical protein